MINTIKLEKYQNIANCRTDYQFCRKSFLSITYQFEKNNVYGLVSDFGCGSWGLVTCIGGRAEERGKGKILLNDKEILSNELSVYSAFVTEKIFPEINSSENLMTVKECIQKALEISGQEYSAEEIKSIFRLSDERFDRPLEYVSGEIWLISMAINFALGKQIFCYPWLNERDINRFEIAYELGVIDYLRERGKIILVPTSQKRIAKKLCDHIIIFEKEHIKTI